MSNIKEPYEISIWEVGVEDAGFTVCSIASPLSWFFGNRLIEHSPERRNKKCQENPNPPGTSSNIIAPTP